MKKFGFKKKNEEDEDKNRPSLFSSRSKNKLTSPSINPYAQPPSTYDSYNQAKLDPNSEEASRGSSSSNPYTKGGPPIRQGGYGGMDGDGYGSGSKTDKFSGNGSDTGLKGKKDGLGGYISDNYGAQSGYGADRYGSGPLSSQPSNIGSRYGPGGYGGLDSGGNYKKTMPNDERESAYGEEREHSHQRSQHSNELGQPPPYRADYGQGGQASESGAYRSETNNEYEAYGDRQLTAEEEEEEDVQATKQEIRFIKQADVSSTRNALRIAAQAEETGRNTLARIGAQGERIHNTEKNLDLTANHNRIAEEKARELRTLNKSMFAVHVSNPFTASSRRQKRDDEVLEKHRSERAMREATRMEGYETDRRLQQTFKEMETEGRNPKAQKSSLAERAKFQFEADEEDDEMENEIDSNLNALHGAAVRLNGIATATGKELAEQNRHLERINQKVYFSFFYFPRDFRLMRMQILTWNVGHSGRRSDCDEQGKARPI